MSESAGSSGGRLLHLRVTEGGGDGLFEVTPCPEQPKVPRDCHVLVREMKLDLDRLPE